MPVYEAYGFLIDSEILLPELFPGSSPADIKLRIGLVPFLPPETSKVICRPQTASELIVHFRGVGTALIQSGRDIKIQPAEGFDPLTLRLFILQQVLGVALLQSGYLVLHASSAIIDGKAVAFAGVSGQGKSTMAAALNRLDCPVLTDDVLAIDLRNPDRPLALPGLLHLKLTEQARVEIGSDILAEQTIRDRVAKKLCAIRGTPARKPAPLHSIYLLTTGQSVDFQVAPPAKAAIELVRQTYGADLLPHLGRSISHFQQCAALANRIPISVLARPRDLSLLNPIAEQVIARVRNSLPS